MYVLNLKKKVWNGTEGAHVTSHFSTNIKSQKLNSDSDKKLCLLNVLHTISFDKFYLLT